MGIFFPSKAERDAVREDYRLRHATVTGVVTPAVAVLTRNVAWFLNGGIDTLTPDAQDDAIANFDAASDALTDAEPNGCITARHRPAWSRAADDARALLAEKRLSTLQRATLVEDLDRIEAVLNGIPATA
jgi:hypothetical protein